MTDSTVQTRGLFAKIRGDLRERREARARYQTLQQELASYQTRREIDDLLGAISEQEGPEADQIREILLDNLRPNIAYHRVAKAPTAVSPA
jgi:hypothetical protein